MPSDAGGWLLPRLQQVSRGPGKPLVAGLVVISAPGAASRAAWMNGARARLGPGRLRAGREVGSGACLLYAAAQVGALAGASQAQRLRGRLPGQAPAPARAA